MQSNIQFQALPFPVFENQQSIFQYLLLYMWKLGQSPTDSSIITASTINVSMNFAFIMVLLLESLGKTDYWKCEESTFIAIESVVGIARVAQVIKIIQLGND